MAINTIVFDYGGVLTHPPREAHISRIAELLELSVSQVAQRTIRFRRLYDKGSIDAAEYWRLMSGESDPPPVETLSELVSIDTESWTRPNEESIALLRELKEHDLCLGLLSNMQPDCLEYVREHFTWTSYFDAAIYSCEVDLTKPDPAIYRLCLERLGARPEESVFIDDTWENVEAARRLGMDGITFEGTSSLRSALAEMLALPALSR